MPRLATSLGALAHLASVAALIRGPTPPCRRATPHTGMPPRRCPLTARPSRLSIFDIEDGTADAAEAAEEAAEAAARAEEEVAYQEVAAKFTASIEGRSAPTLEELNVVVSEEERGES